MGKSDVFLACWGDSDVKARFLISALVWIAGNNFLQLIAHQTIIRREFIPEEYMN